MRPLYMLLGALIVLGATGVVYATHTAPPLEDRVATLEALHGIDYSDPTATEPATATAVPPTATATATNTPEPSTFNDGWHGPLAHDGLNVHEHGQAPPQWVLDSGFPPVFPEGPEAHQGHKFACDSMGNGVQSCIQIHILSNGADTDGDGFSDTGARSVPFHSFALWIMAPDGSISYWKEPNAPPRSIVMSPDGVNPAPLRTSDTGERPIILSVNDGGCETWYSKPGAALFDLGWTICGRQTRFNGENAGGDGTFRTADWVIPADRLGNYGAVQLSPTLADYCEVQFGVCRFTFLSSSVDFGTAEQPN